MHRSLEPISAKFRRGERVTVVAFGDGVTASVPTNDERGADDGNDSALYHEQWRQRLLSENPTLELSIVNRGVRDDTIDGAHARVSADVIDPKPDAVIVAFGVNDCRTGPQRIDHFERELSRLVWRIRQARIAVILVTAGMLQSRAPVQTSGWMTHYTNRIREVAGERDVPLADGYARWESARARGVNTDSLLIDGTDQPNRAGHALLAEALYDVLH